jgi:hypothetical protein
MVSHQSTITFEMSIPSRAKHAALFAVVTVVQLSFSSMQYGYKVMLHGLVAKVNSSASQIARVILASSTQ